ncbi:hypothetical protein GQ42DRAFT_170620 [Ramicandelaber brevisporus]|nr:hypothetical protein GQ42DRAFT_170620 [Ramicandelaber brevisporus]
MSTPVSFLNNKNKPAVFVTAGDNYIGYRIARTMLSSDLKQHFDKIIVGNPSSMHKDDNISDVKCSTEDQHQAAERDKKREEWIRELQQMGAKLVQYDVTKPDQSTSLRNELKNIDIAVLIPPCEHSTQRSVKDEAQRLVHETKAMLHMLEQVKVETLVQWSVLKASKGTKQESGMVALEVFHEIEKAVKDASDKFNGGVYIAEVGFLLDCLYFWRTQIQHESRLALPIGDGKFAPVAMKDVAKAIATIASEGRRRSLGEIPEEQEADDETKKERRKVHTLSLMGAEKVNGKQLAKCASKGVGAQIQFKDVSEEDADRVLKQCPEVTPFVRHLILEKMKLIKKNEYNVSKNDLEKYLHGKPESISSFFSHHKDEFKPRQ